MLVVPAMAAAADPNQVSFTLEGCRATSPTPYPETGPFVCLDGYTTGNLGKFWNEGDYVPFRITADNNNGAQTYSVVVAADYRLGTTLGYDLITAPTLNTALSTNGGAGCVLAPSTLQYAPPDGGPVGGIDETIYRELTITQPTDATCVYDYAQRLAIDFPGRTAAGTGAPAPLGAAEYSGSSLHGYLLNQDLTSSGIGQKRVPIPVNDIEPQGFAKTVDGVRGTGFAWGVTKSSGPAGFPDTCTGATTSGPVQVRVEWTRTAIAAGQVAVTTTFIFENPAHRQLDVSVEDVLRATDGGPVIDSFTKTYQVRPGHREFSVTQNVSTASDTLFNTATVTYTDPLEGGDYGQIVATDSGTVTTATGAAINSTATITDVEQITGNGLTFSVDSVTTDPLGIGGFVPADADRTNITGPLTWESGPVSSSGSVTFMKRIHVAQGLTTSGSLSDIATLKPSDTGAIVGTASTPIQAIGCGTVSGTKFNDADRDGTRDAGEPGLAGWTFFVDYDGDGTLDPGEPSAVSTADGSFTITGVKPGTFTLREVSQPTWVCTMPNPCTYQVTLSGNASTGNVFGNYQLKPSILLDKTGPATAPAGSLIAYIINISNNGDLPLAAMTVVVTDPLCTAAPTLVSKNGDASPNSLDPGGDRWTYTCSVQTQVGQTLVDNVATVTAADQFNRTVTSTDNAVTTLTQPPPPPPAPTGGSASVTPPPPPAPVSPEPPTRVITGRAILHGPTKCVPRSFNARVTGRRIARVRFYVDGKLVSTVTRPNGPGLSYQRVIDPKKFAGGKHRVVARVKFLASSQTQEVTRTFAFTRCARAVRAVQFTG